MNETEWLESRFPQEMLEYLWRTASARKLRLAACAWCRLPAVWRLLVDPASQTLVEAAELFAERGTGWERVIELARTAPAGRVSGGSFRGPNPVHLPPSSQAQRAVLELAQQDAREAALGVARMAANLIAPTACDVLREVVGNPFRRCWPDPVWLAWESGTIERMARGIHDEQAFDRLPILADALEEAGCDDEEVLNHCRGLRRCHACLGAGKRKVTHISAPRRTRPSVVEDEVPCFECERRGFLPLAGEHLRGCWVVDGLLGRG